MGSENRALMRDLSTVMLSCIGATINMRHMRFQVRRTRVLFSSRCGFNDW